MDQIGYSIFGLKSVVLLLFTDFEGGKGEGNCIDSNTS